MSGISIETAQAHLDAWIEAELAITNGQSYTIGSKTLNRASLGEIRNQIEYWNNMVAKLTNIAKRKGRNRVMRVVPQDL